MNKLFWKLPYELRRTFFKRQNPVEFQKLMNLRTRIPEKITGQTFKPFLDNQCIFVHIPKSAGISVGYSLFNRHTGNHTTIANYQIAFSKKEFNSFYKFTFVRNPWDRLLSAYLFLKKGGRNKADAKWALEHLEKFKNFEDFVLNWITPENAELGIHFKPQYGFVTNPGSLTLKVDFVGRFENLSHDFNLIQEKLNISSSLVFENETESKKEDYKTYYTEKTREIVAQVYKEDIELFGYNF